MCVTHRASSEGTICKAVAITGLGNTATHFRAIPESCILQMVAQPCCFGVLPLFHKGNMRFVSVSGGF
jgi:hypothetical protein